MYVWYSFFYAYMGGMHVIAFRFRQACNTSVYFYLLLIPFRSLSSDLVSQVASPSSFSKLLLGP